MRNFDEALIKDRAVAFCNWLKENHTGIENAIKFRSMNNQWGDHRTLRHIVHHLRTTGHPICSGNVGYYYAKNKKEVEGVMKYLDSFISRYQEAFEGLNQSIKNGI